MVTEYTYLGLVITNTLSMERMVDERCKKAKAALTAMQRFLTNYTVAPSIRINTVKAMLLPVCMYGAEVWGGNKDLDGKMQVYMNDALKCIVQGWGSRDISAVTQCLEFGIPMLHALFLKQRFKGWLYGKDMSVVLGDLISTRNTYREGAVGPIHTTERLGSNYLIKRDERDKEHLSEERRKKLEILLEEAAKRKARRSRSQNPEQSLNGQRLRDVDGEQSLNGQRLRDVDVDRLLDVDGEQSLNGQRLRDVDVDRLLDVDVDRLLDATLNPETPSAQTPGSKKEIVTTKSYFREFFNRNDLEYVVMEVWLEQILSDKTKTLAEALQDGRLWNRVYLDAWFSHPELGEGFQVITMMRMGRWDPGEKLRRDKADAAQHCPCCM